jgi:molecular chaperone Hsp33
MSAGTGPGAGAAGETDLDQVLAFTVAGRDVRGRIVRLGPVLDTILGAHAYPPALRHLLAEALVLAALMGSLLKSEDSQLTVQAQAQGGPIDLLVCDYRGGELRGYARHDPAELAALGSNPGLEALFGEGYLAVTFDIGESGQRYQGIVPLVGASLAEACESYFRQSEQIPTLIRLAVKSGPDGTRAAGLLAQHLPEGEEGRARLHVRQDHPDWEHMATLAGSIRHGELLAPGLTLEDIVWRLFHDEQEIRVLPGPVLSRGCRCSAEYYRSVLAKFPEGERDHMRNAAGVIAVDCAFCSRVFDIDL